MNAQLKKPFLSEKQLSGVAARFKALSEPMRLRILQFLCGGERNVTDITAHLRTSQANVSKHLSLLVTAGVLRRRKAGLNVFYEIADPVVFQLCEIVCTTLPKR